TRLSEAATSELISRRLEVSRIREGIEGARELRLPLFAFESRRSDTASKQRRTAVQLDTRSAAVGLIGWFAGGLRVLGIVGSPHAEAPLAAYVVRILRGGMAWMSPFMLGLYILVVTIIDFGQ